MCVYHIIQNYDPRAKNESYSCMHGYGKRHFGPQVQEWLWYSKRQIMVPHIPLNTLFILFFFSLLFGAIPTIMCGIINNVMSQSILPSLFISSHTKSNQWNHGPAFTRPNFWRIWLINTIGKRFKVHFIRKMFYM